MNSQKGTSSREANLENYDTKCNKQTQKHCKEKSKDISVSNITNIYNKYINNDNFFFYIFPDKEIICKKYLPDNFIIKNRDKLDFYKKKFTKNLIDTTSLFDEFHSR